MISLIYGSSATKKLSDSELIEILDVARHNNQKLNITGMLLYSDGNFIQVLEGEQDAVLPLFEKISLDPRHRGVMVYVKHPIEKREFGHWEMGFVNTKSVDFSQISGYSNYLNDPDHLEHLHDYSYAKSFLSIFRDSIR